MRLDHLLSKEHIPRTLGNCPGLLGWSVRVALVVFTSGIVDDVALIGSWLSSVLLVLPRGGRVWNLEDRVTQRGPGTLLSFEESDRAGGFPWWWAGVSLRLPLTALGWLRPLGCGPVVVVGGRVVCELDSGREHLRGISHHGVSRLSACPVFVVGWVGLCS